MRHSLAALSALVLAACDGSLLFAEVQIPDLQITLPSRSFPAVAASLPTDWCDPAVSGDPQCLGITSDYDLGAEVPALTEQGVTYDLRLTRVAITLSAVQQAGAPPDLSGIESAFILVGHDPAVPGSGTVVASYQKPSPSATPTVIAVTGNANVDLGPYLDAGTLPVRVEVYVSNGTAAFDADLTVGFSLVVNVDWGSYL